jgi:hypothetical protein
METRDLGPKWEPAPEQTGAGLERYWLRSRRFGVARNEQGAWSVVDRAGRETHGDLIWDIDEAMALAERCDAVEEQAAAPS